MGKRLIDSKEFWVLFPTFIVSLLALPEFIAVVPVSWVPAISLISSAVTLYIRMVFTKDPISSIF